MMDNMFNGNGIGEHLVTAQPKHLNTIKLIVLSGDNK